MAGEKRRALRFLPAEPTEKQRKEASGSVMCQLGDMRLVWVNEGDLAIMQVAKEAVNYGKEP